MKSIDRSNSTNVNIAKDLRDLLHGLDLEDVNEYLGKRTATERIEWAADTFDARLFALTSAGIDSALMLNHINNIRRSIPVIHINTGFLPEETLEFRNKLTKIFKLQLHEFGPNKQQIADITDLKLWDEDLALYSKLTKLDPMTKAVNKLRVRALLTGIRADQTDNRAKLGIITKGNDGEFRINPFIDWSKAEVSNYIKKNNLPRHSLYKKGFESVGDKQMTVSGKNRSGRKVMECGLHVIDGKILKSS